MRFAVKEYLFFNISVLRVHRGELIDPYSITCSMRDFTAMSIAIDTSSCR